jgi:hypothetical protein
VLKGFAKYAFAAAVAGAAFMPAAPSYAQSTPAGPGAGVTTNVQTSKAAAARHLSGFLDRYFDLSQESQTLRAITDAQKTFGLGREATELTKGYNRAKGMAGAGSTKFSTLSPEQQIKIAGSFSDTLRTYTIELKMALGSAQGYEGLKTFLAAQTKHDQYFKDVANDLRLPGNPPLVAGTNLPPVTVLVAPNDYPPAPVARGATPAQSQAAPAVRQQAPQNIAPPPQTQSQNTQARGTLDPFVGIFLPARQNALERVGAALERLDPAGGRALNNDITLAKTAMMGMTRRHGDTGLAPEALRDPQLPAVLKYTADLAKRVMNHPSYNRALAMAGHDLGKNPGIIDQDMRDITTSNAGIPINADALRRSVRP